MAPDWVDAEIRRFGDLGPDGNHHRFEIFKDAGFNLSEGLISTAHAIAFYTILYDIVLLYTNTFFLVCFLVVSIITDPVHHRAVNCTTLFYGYFCFMCGSSLFTFCSIVV